MALWGTNQHYHFALPLQYLVKTRPERASIAWYSRSMKKVLIYTAVAVIVLGILMVAKPMVYNFFDIKPGPESAEFEEKYSKPQVGS